MIAIVDYKAGNLTSVRLALEHLGMQACITSEPDTIRSAERVVFPGVGAIGSAMKNLAKLGLCETIRDVAAAGTPFLGICLGTQIILNRSEEDGSIAGLGLIPGAVRRFRPVFQTDKVPQMGWNTIIPQRKHPVFEGIPDSKAFYFVHSYYPMPMCSDDVLAVTDYAGTTFASVMGRDNIVATQFHPERSGEAGLRLILNFCGWNGENKPGVAQSCC